MTLDRAALRRLAERAQSARPGAWELQTSNSFRRVGTARGDGDVLCATRHPCDGQQDLLAAHGVLEHVVAAQPRVVIELLDRLDELEARVTKLEAAVLAGEAARQ